MPFLVALAIALHVAVLAPLYLLVSNDHLSLDPYELLQWPLLAAFGSALILGVALRVTTTRGMLRPLAVASCLGLYLFVQFYLLIWDFGPFDGQIIDFSSYRLVGVLELSVLAALAGCALAWPRVTAPLFSRLLVLLLCAGIASGAWQILNVEGSGSASQAGAEPVGNRDTAYAEQFFKSKTFFKDTTLTPGLTSMAGKERNVVIILLDTLQVDVFQASLARDANLQTQFKGFTLFTNASSLFPFTALSIPAILAGEAYRNDEETIPNYLDRVASKRVEAVLAEQRGVRVSRLPLLNRADFLNAESAACRNYGMLYDLYGFRQLPTVFKPYFYDEGRFRFARLCDTLPPTNSEIDLAVFQKLIAQTSARAEVPTFKFIHLWGAHPPAVLSSDCTLRSQTRSLGDLQGQAHCMLRQTGAYLDRLRSLGVFDNSMVFVISDHGSRFGFLSRSQNPNIPSGIMSSANPLFAFHDFGDRDEFRTSDAPTSLLDIYPTILHRFGASAPDTGGRVLERLAADLSRERIFTNYRNTYESQRDHLKTAETFVIRGNVLDPSAWSRMTTNQKRED